jgi:hypothetical protein
MAENTRRSTFKTTARPDSPPLQPVRLLPVNCHRRSVLTEFGYSQFPANPTKRLNLRLVKLSRAYRANGCSNPIWSPEL